MCSLLDNYQNEVLIRYACLPESAYDDNIIRLHSLYRQNEISKQELDRLLMVNELLNNINKKM